MAGKGKSSGNKTKQADSAANICLWTPCETVLEQQCGLIHALRKREGPVPHESVPLPSLEKPHDRCRLSIASSSFWAKTKGVLDQCAGKGGWVWNPPGVHKGMHGRKEKDLPSSHAFRVAPGAPTCGTPSIAAAWAHLQKEVIVLRNWAVIQELSAFINVYKNSFSLLQQANVF